MGESKGKHCLVPPHHRCGSFLFLPFASAANFLCRLLLLLLSKTMMLDKQHDKNENDGEKNDRNGEKNSGNNGITMVPPPIRLNLWYV
jgi:hypothetical protein